MSGGECALEPHICPVDRFHLTCSINFYCSDMSHPCDDGYNKVRTDIHSLSFSVSNLHFSLQTQSSYNLNRNILDI